MDPVTEVSLQNIFDKFHISSFHREDKTSKRGGRQKSKIPLLSLLAAFPRLWLLERDKAGVDVVICCFTAGESCGNRAQAVTVALAE